MYLDIYREAHNNAVELFIEAQALYGRKSYARAYALAYTALEEISKSQFAADVYSGLNTEEQFKDFYRSHARKLERVQWVHSDANSWPYNLRWIGPDEEDVESIAPGAPVFSKRQGAMYVDVDFSAKKVTRPVDAVSDTDARDMLDLVEVAMHRIVSVEEDQGLIGTKGFMK